MKSRSIVSITAGAGLLALAAAAPVAADGPRTGAVYTLSNDPAGNAVIAYRRSSDGGLAPLGTYPTGGRGSGAGLGSGGAVTLSDDGRTLLAVDPGSDELTAFRVRRDGRLSFADRVASGGDHPISVAVDHDLVYVVNDGGDGDIAGFELEDDGDLAPIAGSTRPLSTNASAPAQIAFGPGGRSLVVTEKATDRITTYALRADGRAGAPSWIASAGHTPFGFDVDGRGHAIVSEAWGGQPSASTVSSYDIHRGEASLADGPVATSETAACWVVVTDDGRFAYVANTGSGTVTGLAIAGDGDLRLLDASGVTGVSGGAPSDVAVSDGSGFLFVRTGGSVHAFRVARDGSLTDLGATTIQGGIVGLAAS